jgi:hypothetical protein
MLVTTVFVMIGNSDDKLSQDDWHQFWGETSQVLLPVIKATYGVWFSDPVARYQNACWAFEPWPQHESEAKVRLARLASKWGQDSVAWAEAEDTVFLGPAWLSHLDPEEAEALDDGHAWAGLGTEEGK